MDVIRPEELSEEPQPEGPRRLAQAQLDGKAQV
jgi:hypothetical protein